MPIFRASELDRLFECGGSAYIPRAPDTESVSAAWGTKVHYWAETGAVTNDEDGVALAKRIAKSGTDRDKLWPGGEHEVALALNLVTGEARRYHAPIPLPSGYTDRSHKAAWKAAFDDEWVTGTLDFVGELMDMYWVDDLKTGRNAHWKDYEKQQLFYCVAWSKLKYGEITEGRSTITHWPRYPIARPPQRHGTQLSVSYQLDYYGKLQALRTAVLKNRVDQPLEALVYGEHCRWCPSQINCSKFTIA